MQTHPLIAAALATALLATTLPTLAQSTDLRTWAASGDVTASANSATLTTAAIDSGESPLSAQSALYIDALEAALALPSGALGLDAWEGSALYSSFNAAAGTRLTLDWTLSTTGFDSAFADRAFAVIDGSTVALIAQVAATPLAGSFSHIFASSGAHTLALGVLDINDVTAVSSFTVSGLQVSAVPEPGEWALLIGGLLVLPWLARRRRVRAAGVTRRMTKRLLAATTLAVTSLGASADTLALWNFNDSNLTVDVGTGTAALVGGTTTSGFNSGGGSSDAVQPGFGWSISSFAAQGTGDKQRGAAFSLSTLGFENIGFSYDMRHSNTAAGDEVVQVSTDGVNFSDLASFSTNNNGAAQPLWFNGRSVDLSALPLGDNQASLTFRVVATFAPGTASYAVSNTSGTYGTTGTWRFDMVTVSGTPIVALPEPGSVLLLLVGLGLLVGLAGRLQSRHS